MSSRPRFAERTRETIRRAARDEFARAGYERTTIRAVASAAEVDPSLVMRYFENKAGLFARAVEFEVRLPDLAGLGPDAMADTLAGRFFAIWEDDGTFLALLRAAASSETAGARMREVFAAQIAPALARAAVDRPLERAGMVGALVLGFAFGRYLVGVPVLAEMTRADVLAWFGPTLVHILTSEAPCPAS